MKKKTKLIIFPGNFLPHVGGLETHVDEFVKYLSRKNYEITIFVPNIVLAKEDEIIYDGVRVLRYPAFEAVLNFPVPKFWSLKFWKMFFSLYGKNFDIVMTRTRFFTNSFLGAFFAKFRLKRIKLVHVEHGSEFVKLSSRFKSFVALVYDMTFGKFVFFLADKNIAISDAVYSFVSSNFVDVKKEKVPVIRRGVDFDFYRDIDLDLDLKRKFKGKTIITFLGRLYKWKGVENSIEAYKLLPEDMRKKSVFLIVGYGEDFDRLKELSGEFLDNGIYFLGKKDFKDAISILKSTDIYLHSAYAGGGLSNSLLQAMYCSCCVVASPHEGAKEVVVDLKTGILLRDNSSDELAQGLKRVFENKSLQEKYSNNAHKYIEENFSWGNVIESYEKEFENLFK